MIPHQGQRQIDRDFFERKWKILWSSSGAQDLFFLSFIGGIATTTNGVLLSYSKGHRTGTPSANRLLSALKDDGMVRKSLSGIGAGLRMKGRRGSSASQRVWEGQ